MKILIGIILLFTATTTCALGGIIQEYHQNQVNQTDQTTQATQSSQTNQTSTGDTVIYAPTSEAQGGVAHPDATAAGYKALNNNETPREHHKTRNLNGGEHTRDGDRER